MKLSQNYMMLLKEILRGTSETAQNLVLKAKNRIEEIEKKEGALSGISTGFEKLDKLTSGWQPSDLVIVAARPGMGKTALALSMARDISVKQNIPVAFFSLRDVIGSTHNKINFIRDRSCHLINLEQVN